MLRLLLVFYLLYQLHTLSKKQQLTYSVITLLKTTHSLHRGSRRCRGGGAQAPSLLKIFVYCRRLLKTNVGQNFCFSPFLSFFPFPFHIHSPFPHGALSLHFFPPSLSHPFPFPTTFLLPDILYFLGVPSFPTVCFPLPSLLLSCLFPVPFPYLRGPHPLNPARGSDEGLGVTK